MIEEIKPYIAEAFGTACLVFLGCGAATISTATGSLPLGAFAVAMVFGLTLTALIYAIGPISGCHVNPAITVGLWAAKRFPGSKVLQYAISQVLGAGVGAGILLLILQGRPDGYDVAALGLGQTGWGDGYLGQYSMFAALLSETIATFIFTILIIGAISNVDNKAIAGVAIGFILCALIVCFINVSGGSLNPARSIGPAIFVGGNALAQLWLFIICPLIGGLAGGLIYKGIAGAENAFKAQGKAMLESDGHGSL